METVGHLIRHWRKHRRMSQADLADAAEVSARHVSCMETGRARPSREMLLHLTSAMELPLRERNTLLLAAGHAPAYRETDLDAPEMAQVRQALGFLLKQSEPYGAVVVNKRWDLVQMNRPMRALSKMLLDGKEPPKNLMRFTVIEMRPYLLNFDDVARDLLHRLHREAVQDSDDDLYALYRELAATVPPALLKGHWDQAPSLLVPVILEKNGMRLDLFTTLTTVGTPQDITLSELRIESYFPATPETDALLRAVATQSGEIA